MVDWNGTSLIPSPEAQSVPLVSDASGSWGCGAFWGPHWFQWEWEGRAVDWSIAAKELLPILLGLGVWGSNWAGSKIECLCDNAAVVNSGRARDQTLGHLLRCMFFIAASMSVQVHATHIPGALNTAADALSRKNLPSFLQLVQSADPHPAPIPQPILEMTVREQPDSTSQEWARLFSACCKPA